MRDMSTGQKPAPLSELVRRARLNAGYSLRGLATATGLDATLLDGFESGTKHPTLNQMDAITAACGTKFTIYD